MTRNRYAATALAVVAGALLVGLFARAPRSAPRSTHAVSAPTVDLALVVEDGAVAPAASEVPLGSRVRLTITHRGHATVAFALAGYDDRVRIERLEPGTSRRVEFLADRPGEAFAWTLDGEPAGRLVVPGSHLLEGHR